MKNHQQGFTLIELMIVVAIIAILAAIALPQYFSYVGKTKISQAIGGVAGEKIKVAENWGSEKPVCTGVAVGVGCDATSGELTGISNDGTAVISLVPDLTADIMTWACTVTTSGVPGYETDDCSDLTP